jgi:hypothetical protein
MEARPEKSWETNQKPRKTRAGTSISEIKKKMGISVTTLAAGKRRI